MGNGFINNDFSAVTSVTSPIVNGGNLQISSNSLISTNANGNVIWKPNGTGTIDVQTGGTSSMTINASGIVSMPKQPYFRASRGTAVSNVTGDGTDYTIVFPTSVIDTRSMYNTGTGVCTYVEQGEYCIKVILTLSGMTSSHTSLRCYISSSGGNLDMFRCNPYNCVTAGGTFTFYCNYNLNPNLSTTSDVHLIVSGGTKVVGIAHTSGRNDNIFSGYLTHYYTS